MRIGRWIDGDGWIYFWGDCAMSESEIVSIDRTIWAVKMKWANPGRMWSAGRYGRGEEKIVRWRSAYGSRVETFLWPNKANRVLWYRITSLFALEFSSDWVVRAEPSRAGHLTERAVWLFLTIWERKWKYRSGHLIGIGAWTYQKGSTEEGGKVGGMGRQDETIPVAAENKTPPPQHRNSN